MPNARFPRTSDHLGRYYTDSLVASLLVRTMNPTKPSLVIDLGAGDGALVGAASKVWTSSRFVTVDIDKNAASARFPLQKGPSFTHHIGDALDSNLSEKLGIRYGSADSALCNPPYIRPRWKKHFGEILEDAGLSHVLPRMADVPATLLFLAQNIRFLKNNGRFGLIVPDGIIAGEKFEAFRRTLVSQHRIERVIELPRGIFRNTEAKAHIVVLAKGAANQDSISVQRIEQDGNLSETMELPTETAGHRLDYSYFENAHKKPTRSQSIVLRDVALITVRGSYSSVDRRNMAMPVFHTTDFSSETNTVPRKFVISQRDASTIHGTIAEPGDILIARVGRNLEEKVCSVKYGKVVVSDCIIVLRILSEYRARAFAYLKSQQGRDALRAIAHGVGAKFITTHALLDIRV